MSLSSPVEYPLQSTFLRLKRLLNGVSCDTTTDFTVTRIMRGSVWGMESMNDFSHMFALFLVAKMKSEVYHVFHIALWKEFRLTLCINVR